MKQKRIAGALGLAGAVIFAAAAVTSIPMFERGAYSPFNCFVSELGAYTGASITFSSALVFNIGLMLSGVLFGVFMVMSGLRGETVLDTALSFFGVLTGILMAAQGLISLNFYTYHYFIASAFFVSLFIMCALYIVSNMVLRNRWSKPVPTIAAFLAGAAAALSAGYMITGGLTQVFEQDASGIGRLSFIPFAAVGWAAFTLFVVFIAAVSAGMPAKKKPDNADPSSGPKKKNR